MYTLLINTTRQLSAPLFIRVKTIEDASQAWTDYSNNAFIGASEMRDRCGNVYNEKSQVVARIMYNGRIMTKEEINMSEATVTETVETVTEPVEAPKAETKPKRKTKAKRKVQVKTTTKIAEAMALYTQILAVNPQATRQDIIKSFRAGLTTKDGNELTPHQAAGYYQNCKRLAAKEA